MQKNYFVQGIKCTACTEKITILLKTKLLATTVTVSNSNTKLTIKAPTEFDITLINSLLKTIGDYRVSEELDTISNHTGNNLLASYKPIYLIFAYLIIVNGLIFYKHPNFTLLMTNFMSGFFLIFSFFKIIDLNGFAMGYSTYDLIAKKFYYYGYIYPFFELLFGIILLIAPMNLLLNLAIFVIMLISAVGVIKSKLSKQEFTCACVGSFLKVPLGNIAIVENMLMVVMSAYMLFHLALI